MFGYRTLGFGARWPEAEGATTMRDQILATQPGSLIAYWPLDETSGTNADNAEGTAGRDGTYNGVALDTTTFLNGDPAGVWADPDNLDIETTSLEAAFGGNEYSLFCTARYDGTWATVNNQHIIRIFGSGSDNLLIKKQTNGGGRIRFEHQGGGTTEGRNHSTTETGWLMVAMTVTDTGDECKFYFATDASPTVALLATNTGIGTWTATTFTRATIGNESGTTGWDGSIAHCALWDGVQLSLSELQAIWDERAN